MNTTHRQFVQKDLARPSRIVSKLAVQSLSPTSTNDSQSPREPYLLPPPIKTHTQKLRQNKEKSQLCKKYVENGYCPYQKKCKFAHGSHELRKNSQINSKYKTKECGVFMNEGHCMYGQRCNFIHKNLPQTEKAREKEWDWEFLQVRLGVRSESRLLHLLTLH